MDYLLNTFPLIGVLGLSSYHIETLKDIDDVVNAPSFDRQFFGALVQKEQVLAFPSVEEQEPAAQFAQALLLPVVSVLRLLLLPIINQHLWLVSQFIKIQITKLTTSKERFALDPIVRLKRTHCYSGKIPPRL